LDGSNIDLLIDNIPVVNGNNIQLLMKRVGKGMQNIKILLENSKLLDQYVGCNDKNIDIPVFLVLTNDQNILNYFTRDYPTLIFKQVSIIKLTNMFPNSVFVIYKNERKRQQLSKSTESDNPPTPLFDDNISEIIPNFLYLSGEEGAINKQILLDYKINTIINVTDNIPNLFPELFTYHNIYIMDRLDQKISDYFNSTIKLLENIRKNNGKVLVHCSAGKSRSATIVIAYIMKTQNMQFTEAYEFVKARRNVIDPNLGFIGQLIQFNKILNT
jgi:protein phosphatase slingshot